MEEKTEEQKGRGKGGIRSKRIEEKQEECCGRRGQN